MRPGVCVDDQVCVLGATTGRAACCWFLRMAKGAAIALLAAGTVLRLCLLGGVSWVLGQRLPGLLLTRADLTT